ncbi:GNAT family N-acetyltransferase [Vallicoccus soli]|uniref:GNAT family N-acetyltransferase n=1 Tax=Vallicoccus soli TaxID=2339232 RepID=UPI0014033437|nr:GNAT family N-acetyltransferase [Vallicoccus soli]
MPRPPVTVREAVPDDLPDLVALWHEVRAAAGSARAGLPLPSDEAVLALLARARADEAVHVDVAVLGGAVAGVLVTGRAPASLGAELLGRPPVLEVACLHVREACRRQGAGRALLARAAELAERCGTGGLVADVPAQHRDAQRFYARLGFAPGLVRRAAALPALRRALAPAERSAAVGDLLARRRGGRARRAARPAGPAGLD